MRATPLWFLGAALVFSASPAGALPVRWSGNGHWYMAVYVCEGTTWDVAKAAAESAGGYLATVTSAEENEFIYELISDPRYWFLGAPGYSFGPWLGGYQYDNEDEPAGHWRWVTDDPWIYTNWAQNTPNNVNGNEDWLHYFTNTNVGTLTPGPTWNDAPITNLERGYVIEWGPSPVEPTTWGKVKWEFRK